MSTRINRKKRSLYNSLPAIPQNERDWDPRWVIMVLTQFEQWNFYQ